MPILFKRATGWKWRPDADDTNAPEGTLLRADNTISDRVGARSNRLGSEERYELLGADGESQRVHSLYTADLEGTKVELAGVGNELYIDGGIVYRLADGSATDEDDEDGTKHVEPSAIDIGGEGRFSFGDDAYQTFVARGGSKKKYDREKLNNWGIAAPQLKATLAANNAITLQVGDFNVGETNGNDFVQNEGDATYHDDGGGGLQPVYVDDYTETSEKAMSLQPDAGTGRASCTKIWDGDTDMHNFRGNQGGQSDLFDMRLWFEDPRKVDKITIMFGLDTGDDPFLDNYYYFDFQIRNNGTVDIKDPESTASEAYNTANNRLLSPLTPQEATGVKSPQEAGRVLRQIGYRAGSRSRERTDAQAASPAWGHLAVTRGQFSRVGGQPGRDWQSVRGFKVVYTAIPGTTKLMNVDDAVWSGAGRRALTGTFNVGYRFARKFIDDNGGEIYTELSPMSPISADLVMQQQTLQVTIPAAAVNAKDPQVNQVWIYLYGGWLDTYYRVAVVPAQTSSGMTIDDISRPNNLNSWWEWARLTSHGFSVTDHQPTAVEDLIANVYKSELDALVENEPFEPGASGPPNRIIGIAGPARRRLFVLTSEGWLYPSTQKSPSSYSLYHTVDLRQYGTPYWLSMTPSGLFAGCSKDIVRINGSGDNNGDGVTADIWAEPLMVANPPIDSSVAVDGNAVMYRAKDGPMMFTGASATPLPFEGTSLLWRGENRHGVEAINTQTGLFSYATDNHFIYVLVPEGSDTDPTSVWRYGGGEWCRFTYPYTLISLHTDQLGRLLAGTTTGEVLEIEKGNSDDGSPVEVHILTPLTEGRSPLARKEPADLQLHCVTGGLFGTIEFYTDRSTEAVKTVSFATSGDGIYRAPLTDLGAFLRVQVRIRGAFNVFSLHALGITYHDRPNHVVVLNMGHVIPQDAADLAWINQVEFDLYSEVSPLYLEIYKSGQLHSTEEFPVKIGERDVYTVVPPRDSKARRLGLILRTDGTAGEGFIGFELYAALVRHAATGNVTELRLTSGDDRSDV